MEIFKEEFCLTFPYSQTPISEWGGTFSKNTEKIFFYTELFLEEIICSTKFMSLNGTL